MSDNVSIAGLDKAVVLTALFNGARTHGFGLIGYNDSDISIAWAQAILSNGYVPNFDILMGRILRVDISGDNFDPSRYDYYNGQGAAKTIIDKLRSNNGNPNDNPSGTVGDRTEQYLRH